MIEPAADVTIDSEDITLARSIDEFEGYVNPHAGRIAGLADAIAERFALSPHDRETLKKAALVHDLGEMIMDRDYVKADRTLTARERLDLQRHPVIGEQEASKRGYSRAVQQLVRWHHEWWNGDGYPDRLERNAIPLGARILRVCDTYVALTDARPYSMSVTSVEAKRYLTEWAGLEFDPRIVFIFLELEGLASLESSADDIPGPVSF